MMINDLKPLWKIESVKGIFDSVVIPTEQINDRRGISIEILRFTKNDIKIKVKEQTC